MDAFDRYRFQGEASDLFDHFGEPRDYWVRSTRHRMNRVYPTKAIVGHVLSTKDIHGGWNQPTGPVSRLHNSGFVIVDSNDLPIQPPDRDYVLKGADRIRLCALNYFIAPARENAAKEVSIVVSDIAWALSLSDASPNICQALGGEKFQHLAQVSPPTYTEPNPSSSTVFTYQLSSQADQATVTQSTLTPPRSPTNLILYGPPGTGKTYRTAWEAVRLCEGEHVAEQLKGDDKRAALMERYRKLVDNHRIEFVTFHQSMSYEEFVEGLRPVPMEEDAEGLSQNSSSAGFRLEPFDGVFKRVSENARINRSAANSAKRLDRSARVFKVALGNRQIEEDRQRIRFGLDNSLIHVGWGGNIDWSDERFDEFSEIFSEWKRKDPQATGLDGNVVITYSLRADMQVGDYVVVSDGRDRIQAFGKVTGEYFYDELAAFHPHRRRVEWLWRDDKGTERSRFYPKTFRRHSIYKLNQSLVDWEALDDIVFGGDVPQGSQSTLNYVLIIDEINRANISKVLGELITLLEPDKRLGMPNEIRLTLPYSKKPFAVPANLHIIGTMNTADRSIALLDTALRRRFTFEELMPDLSVLSENVGGINVRKLLATINERVEYLFDREHQIGHAYFTSCKTRADVEDAVRYRVIPLLAEYFYEDWSRVAAVLGDTGQSGSRFIEARPLRAPAGLAQDDLGDEKQRWLVKSKFDFSEFHAQ
ncbi:ATPase [Devosia soli]|uniref:ATPase n=2 Tax=Devosia soli TaxID=361041 RepID=A0A0F5LDQ0_9HYPH|nr:ATPase [Devosia soli]